VILAAVLAIAFLLLALDWAQTLRIAREPERFSEGWNLILPAHPCVLQVHLWFAAVALLSGIALWLLPWAPIPLGLAGCVIEGICVVHNYRLGLKP
jgi:hypothetical protein